MQKQEQIYESANEVAKSNFKKLSMNRAGKFGGGFV